LCAGANRISRRTQTLCPGPLHFAPDPMYLLIHLTYCYKNYIPGYPLGSWSSLCTQLAPNLLCSHNIGICLHGLVTPQRTAFSLALWQKCHVVILYNNLSTLRIILICAVSICLEVSRPPVRHKIAPEQNISRQSLNLLLRRMKAKVCTVVLGG
jgi:hypothetical protein